MSTSSSCPKPTLLHGEIVDGFKILKKLGSGGFGAVYSVQRDYLFAAMKTEFAEENQSLKTEIQILRLLQHSEHFCKLYAARKVVFGKNTINYIVITMCGRPLSRLRKMMPRRHFSVSTAARLSLQILEAINDIHQIGILHRDVKSSNCGINPANRKLILYDLGLCRKFLELDRTTGKFRYRAPRKSVGFMGTTKYCSLNAHNQLDQCRRDDLWAWLYTTVEFYLGTLPWAHEDDSHLIYRTKCKVGRKIISKCPREILSIYEHVRQLGFDSHPDYNFMFRKFNEMFIRIDIDTEDPYDFEAGSEFYDEFYRDHETDSEIEMNKKMSMEETIVTLNSTMSDSRDGLATKLRKFIGFGKSEC